MKKTLLLSAIALSVIGVAQENLVTGNTNKQPNKDTTVSSTPTAKFLSLEDAQKVLGKPAHLKDTESRSKMANLSEYYNCMYRSIEKSKKDTVSSLFFSLEEYVKLSEAERNYNLIKEVYKKSGSPTDISDIGNEGFLAPDKLNCPFIVIRKGNKVFKFKMDYARSASSVNELNALVKKIVSLN